MAIVRIADNNMVGALRSVLIERGLDPRDFTLCAFGGAGPLHATALIREMGIPRAIVPIHPAQFSAYGFIMTNARVDRQRTTQLTQQALRHRRAAEQIMADAGRRGRRRARGAGLRRAGSRSSRRSRCAISARTTSSSCRSPPTRCRSRRPSTSSGRRFHEAHEARFGFAIPARSIEIVNYTVTVIAAHRQAGPAAHRGGEGPPSADRRAPASLHRRHPRRPVYRREGLRSGHVHRGPGAGRGGGLGDGGRAGPAADGRRVRPSPDRSGGLR